MTRRKRMELAAVGRQDKRREAAAGPIKPLDRFVLDMMREHDGKPFPNTDKQAKLLGTSTFSVVHARRRLRDAGLVLESGVRGGHHLARAYADPKGEWKTAGYDPAIPVRAPEGGKAKTRRRRSDAKGPAAVPTKHCGKCGQDKPRSAFSQNSTTRDGLQNWCRDCMSAYDSVRRRSRPGSEGTKALRKAIDGLNARVEALDSRLQDQQNALPDRIDRFLDDNLGCYLDQSLDEIRHRIDVERKARLEVEAKVGAMGRGSGEADPVASALAGIRRSMTFVLQAVDGLRAAQERAASEKAGLFGPNKAAVEARMQALAAVQDYLIGATKALKEGDR